MTRTVLCPLVLLLWAASAQAQQETRVVRLNVAPAPAPLPALKYELLPTRLERTPGNAAPLYYRAAVLWKSASVDTKEKIERWAFDTPAENLPLDEIGPLLEADGAMRELTQAARRETCSWELAIDQQAFSLLLPEVQELRALARLLVVNVRFHLAKCEYDEAVEALKTGYAMARDLGSGPTLIHSLVGIAIASMMNRQVETLVQLPDAPNLYWALAALPDPLVDARDGFEYERFALYYEVPLLRQIRTTQFSPSQGEALTNEMIRLVAMDHGGDEDSVHNRLAFASYSASVYSEAKRHLVAEGRSPEQVDAMPVSQVVALYSLDQYHRLADEVFKWFHVPYAQSRDGLSKWNTLFQGAHRRREGYPFITLLPAVESMYAATTRFERELAALRLIEALRIHAASHGGRLPASLEAITDVPLPDDPATGQAFAYRAEGDTSILELAGPPHRRPVRYEIRIRNR